MLIYTRADDPDSGVDSTLHKQDYYDLLSVTQGNTDLEGRSVVDLYIRFQSMHYHSILCAANDFSPRVALSSNKSLYKEKVSKVLNCFGEEDIKNDKIRKYTSYPLFSIYEYLDENFEDLSIDKSTIIDVAERFNISSINTLYEISSLLGFKDRLGWKNLHESTNNVRKIYDTLVGKNKQKYVSLSKETSPGESLLQLSDDLGISSLSAITNVAAIFGLESNFSYKRTTYSAEKAKMIFDTILESGRKEFTFPELPSVMEELGISGAKRSVEGFSIFLQQFGFIVGKEKKDSHVIEYVRSNLESLRGQNVKQIQVAERFGIPSLRTLYKLLKKEGLIEELEWKNMDVDAAQARSVVEELSGVGVVLYDHKLNGIPPGDNLLSLFEKVEVKSLVTLSKILSILGYSEKIDTRTYQYSYEKTIGIKRSALQFGRQLLTKQEVIQIIEENGMEATKDKFTRMLIFLRQFGYRVEGTIYKNSEDNIEAEPIGLTQVQINIYLESTKNVNYDKKVGGDFSISGPRQEGVNIIDVDPDSLVVFGEATKY